MLTLSQIVVALGKRDPMISQVGSHVRTAVVQLLLRHSALLFVVLVSLTGAVSPMTGNRSLDRRHSAFGRRVDSGPDGLQVTV